MITRSEKLSALDAMIDRLAQLKAGHDAPTTLTNDQRQRAAAHQALHAVIDLLNAVPEWKSAGLDFAFLPLMTAIHNINEGGSVGWLSNQAPNRARVPIEISIVRARCAALMELLMRDQFPNKRRESAEFIVKNLPSASRSVLLPQGPRSRAGWQAVAEWRDRAKGSRSRSGEDLIAERDAYQAMLDLAARRPEPLMDFIRASLTALGNYVSESRPPL